MTEIVQNVILNNLIENVVPTNLSKDLKSALYAIWQSQMSYLRISLENQKIHHFDDSNFPFVGKPLNSTLKMSNSEYNFHFPKIFSKFGFRNWIFGRGVDETLKKNSLAPHFLFRSPFSRKKRLYFGIFSLPKFLANFQLIFTVQ